MLDLRCSQLWLQRVPAFWDVTPCSRVDLNRSFRGTDLMMTPESLGTTASKRRIVRAPDGWRTVAVMAGGQNIESTRDRTCSSFDTSLQTFDDITQFDINKELNDI